MAIKGKKTEPEKSTLPARLDEMLLKGFSYQAICDQYETAFKSVKEDVKVYLESNDDGFDVDMGKGFKSDYGTVCMSERSNYSYDKDKLLELVENGTITVATLIELASFPAEKLKTALGEKNFNSLAVNKPTQTLTFKANSEFKESVQEKFKDVLPKDEEEVVEVKKEVKKVEKAEVRVEAPKKKLDIAAIKAKAAKLKVVTTTVTSVEEDLNEIIGE